MTAAYADAAYRPPADRPTSSGRPGGHHVAGGSAGPVPPATQTETAERRTGRSAAPMGRGALPRVPVSTAGGAAATVPSAATAPAVPAYGRTDTAPVFVGHGAADGHHLVWAGTAGIDRHRRRRGTVVRRTAPRRNAELPRSGPLRRRRREVDPAWWSVRAAAWARAGGDCERCGRRLGPGWHGHHRKLRSQLGEHSVCNALALCRRCHRWAHSRRIEAEADGFVVPALGDPATVPVLLHGVRWVLLAADGSYTDAPQEAA